MSYRAPQGPRWIVGLIGGTILGLFALMLIFRFGPQLYQEYQSFQLERCESLHGVALSDGEPLFAFDAGGWTLKGQDTKSRAFIECVRGRLSVETGAVSSSGYPELKVWWYSFSYGLGLTYHPGERNDTTSKATN